MGRSALAACIVRPTGMLFAILGLCFISMLLSVYYVHNVHMTTPLEMMGVGKRHLKEEVKVTSVRDDKQVESFRKDRIVSTSLKNNHGDSLEDDVIVAESLNNIDIPLHIEEKKKDHEGPKESNTKKVNSLFERQPQINVGKTDNKKPQNQEMWPMRLKKQEKKYSLNRSPNPLYEKPVRTRKNWKGEKYIVYLCNSNFSCAGWGDRQHGIFSAYLISLVTNRTFKVDFNFPCTLTKLFHPRIANWKIEPEEFDGLSSTHLYALNDRSFREAMKEIDFDETFPQDVVYLTTNYDFYSSLKKNLRYRDIFYKKVHRRPRPILFADLWQTIFKMNKRVVRKFTPALNRVGNHKLVCAHIRFGRNPSIPHDSDVRNTLATIKPFWEFVKKYSDPSKYRLFVASDWEGFRSKVNHFYKDISIDIEGQVIHIDQIARVSNHSFVESDSVCNGLEKVVADQHVLSKCDILLLTYSVFGKAAAYLRRSNKDLYLMDKGKIKRLVL